MYENLISFRNGLCRFFYKNIFKPIFFKIEPEKMHDGMVLFGEFLGSNLILRKLAWVLFFYQNKKLEQEILGIKFNNPIGLAGGFDKNAQLTGIIPNVGFGFCEIGSVTGEPSEGNPKPRLWRLEKSKSLVVHYGLKNDGCAKIAKKLRGKRFLIPVGTNIAKTNDKKTDELTAGINDFAKAFKELSGIGSYFTVNISCPNTSGGQPFNDWRNLEKLLISLDKIPTKKPVFIKLSPDLGKKEIGEIIGVAKKHMVCGFICTNLTDKRNNKKILEKVVPKEGGISGKVVEDLSNDLISYIYKKTCFSHAQNKKTKGKFVIIGLGGVFSAKDAYKKIKLGASLVQLITGMIYEGPQLISEINQGLVQFLEKDGFKNISEAIGSGI